MTADEISMAQSPVQFWPSETRAFRANGNVDSPPKWAEFKDPLDAISTRFRSRLPKERADGQILSPEDRKALRTLGLSEDADRRAIDGAPLGHSHDVACHWTPEVADA